MKIKTYTNLCSTAFLLGLTSISAASESGGYPAPPGVYGNESLFKEFDQQSAPSEPAEIIPPAPAVPDLPLIFAPSTETETPTTTYLPPAPHQTAAEPAVNPFLPDANRLQQQMQEAANLSFEQWGQKIEEPAQTLPAPVNPYYYGPEIFNQTNSLVNDQLFDNPYPVSRPRQQQQIQQQPPIQQQYQPAYLPDYPTPSLPDYGLELPNNSRYNNYSMPDNSYNQYGQPPDMTRQMPLQPFGNQQYFRKIPADDIIYPPNYPGYR